MAHASRLKLRLEPEPAGTVCLRRELSFFEERCAVLLPVLDAVEAVVLGLLAGVSVIPAFANTPEPAVTNNAKLRCIVFRRTI